MQLPLPTPRCVKPAFVFLAILVLLALNLVPRLTRLPPDGSSPHGLDVNLSFPHTIASSATCSYFPLSPDEDATTLIADFTGVGYPRYALLNGFPPETAAGLSVDYHTGRFAQNFGLYQIIMPLEFQVYDANKRQIATSFKTAAEPHSAGVLSPATRSTSLPVVPSYWLE